MNHFERMEHEANLRKIRKLIQVAKQEGHSDEDIFGFLGKSESYAPMLKEMSEEGYTPSDIIGFFGQKPAGEDLARTAVQAPLGYLGGTPYGWIPELLKLAATGGSQNIMAELMEGEPEYDPQAFEQQLAEQMSYFPALSSVEQHAEEAGFPVEPQSDLQKVLRIGGEVAGFKHGGVPSKAGAGLGAGLTKEILAQTDMPEPTQDFLSYLWALGGASKSPLWWEPPSYGVTPMQRALGIPQAAPPGGGVPPPGGGGFVPPEFPPSRPAFGIPAPPAPPAPPTRAEISSLMEQQYERGKAPKAARGKFMEEVRGAAQAPEPIEAVEAELNRIQTKEWQEKVRAVQQAHAEQQKALTAEYEQKLAKAQDEFRAAQLERRQQLEQYERERAEFVKPPAPIELGKEIKGPSTPSAEGARSLRGRITDLTDAGEVFAGAPRQIPAVEGTQLNIAATSAEKGASAAYRDAYEKAYREAKPYRSVKDPQIRELDDLVKKMSLSVSQTPSEKKVIGDLKKIAEQYEKGGLRADQLLATSDSLMEEVNYAKIHGGPTDQFSGAARVLNQMAERAVKSGGGNSSLIKRADQLFQDWANRFGTRSSGEFLKPAETLTNPEALIEASSTPDGYRTLQRMIGDDPASRQLLRNAQRNVAEKVLPPNLKRGSSEYKNAVRKLRGVIGSEATRDWQETLARRENYLKRVERHAPQLKGETESKKYMTRKIGKEGKEAPKAPTAKEEPVLKEPEGAPKLGTEPKLPEEPKPLKWDKKAFNELTSSPEGIRELRKNMSPENFERVKNYKVRQMFHGEDLTGKVTYEKARGVLFNDSQNKILREFYGDQFVDDLMTAFSRTDRKRALLNFTEKHYKKIAGISTGAGGIFYILNQII